MFNVLNQSTIGKQIVFIIINNQYGHWSFVYIWLYVLENISLSFTSVLKKGESVGLNYFVNLVNKYELFFGDTD